MTSPVRVVVRGQGRGKPITSIAVAYAKPASPFEPDWTQIALESLEPPAEPEFELPIVPEPDDSPSWWKRLGLAVAGRLRAVVARLQTLGRRLHDRLPRPWLPRLRRDRDLVETEVVADVGNAPTSAEELAALYIDHLEQTLNLELTEDLRKAAVCRALFEVSVSIAPEPPTADEILGLKFELLLGLMKPELAEVVDLGLPNDPRAATEWVEAELLWPLLDKFDVWAEMAANLQPKE